MTKPYEVENERKPEYNVSKIFLDRWSPRSLSKDIKEEDLMVLFEAAKWTPSSSNLQPWRFLYTLNGDKNWDKFFNLLGEFNQIWCKNAGALILIISRKTNAEGKTDRLHSFGAGSAFMSLALQARMKNLIVHGMEGFDKDQARSILKIPEEYNVEVMVAVGSQGEIEELHERMQKSEKPNTRKPLKELISKGIFPRDWK